MTKEELDTLGVIAEGKPWDVRGALLRFLATQSVPEQQSVSKQRTLTQNSALHLFFTRLADELNNAGWDMKKTLKEDVDIPWDDMLVKRYLWKPIQKAMLSKESTTELTKIEVGKVYEVLNRHIGEKTGVHVPFPNDPEKDHPFIDALEMAKTVDYPEYKEPVF